MHTDAEGICHEAPAGLLMVACSAAHEMRADAEGIRNEAPARLPNVPPRLPLL